MCVAFFFSPQSGGHLCGQRNFTGFFFLLSVLQSIYNIETLINDGNNCSEDNLLFLDCFLKESLSEIFCDLPL